MGDNKFSPGMAIGAGLGAAAGVAGARSGRPSLIAAPRPNTLFPGMQESYLDSLSAAGVNPESFGTIAEAARTGLPVDQGNFFTALKGSMVRGLDEGRANLIEKFGTAGLRNSQPLLNAGVDFEAQANKDFSTILADYSRQAGESAANRRLQAAQMGAGFGSEPGLAMTPSGTLVTGQQSGVAGALTGGLAGVQAIRQLFPSLFGGGGAAGTAGSSGGAGGGLAKSIEGWLGGGGAAAPTAGALMGGVADANAMGGTLGLGVPGYQVPGAAAGGLSQALSSAGHFLASNPITVGVAGALAAGTAWLKSQAHWEANDVVKNFQEPYDKKFLTPFAAQWDSAIKSGQLTQNQAKVMRAQYIRNFEDYKNRVLEWGQKGDKAKVANQSVNGLMKLAVGPQLDRMDREIASLPA